MEILLHICCAPCSISCIQQLREEGHAPTGFWYNPNIHPFLEYKQRRDTLRQYAQDIALPLIEVDDYGLREFTAAVAANSDGRCSWCYARRLEETAKTAAQKGFPAFTTTLLVSPYQNRELMCEIGAQVGAKYGVEFLPCDFRPRFHQGQDQARELGLYMQKYCGCIYSEEDRFSNRRKKQLHKLHKQQAAQAAAEGT